MGDRADKFANEGMVLLILLAFSYLDVWSDLEFHAFGEGGRGKRGVSEEKWQVELPRPHQTTV